VLMLPPSSTGEAFAWAENVARTWYLDDAGHDRMALDGLETGPTMLVEAFDLILEVTRGIGGESGPPGRRLFRHIKRSGIDRSLRVWALRATVARAAGRRTAGGHRVSPERDRAPVLFISELATPSTLEPSMIVARSLPPGSFRVATADPRADRAWRREGRAPNPLLVPIAEERHLLTAASRNANAAWKAYAADPPSFSFRGRDISSEILAALRPLVRRSVPWLAVERRALERMLEAVGPAYVVVASDQHRIGRLVATLRRTEDWRLIVLQHGLPQDTIGFVPVVADTVAAWSKSSCEWFVARGTAPARLAETGNPRLDQIVRTDRAAIRASVSTRLGLAGRPRLLVALSGQSVVMTEATVALAVEGLGLLPDATIIIKLHPGGGDWSRVHRIVAGLGERKARVRVLDKERLDPLLWWADLVLVHRSSVAVEALAAGTPVVVADLDGKSIADLELHELDLPRVAHGAALAAMARQLINNDERARYLTQRRDRLEAITGPVDGRAAERIAKLMVRPP
jgi:hypothetical protein